jgi:deazaflavin-dependent oxidoreductase (nitroreductase family)
MARITSRMSVRRFRGGAMREIRGMPLLLLETRGARSGQVRQATLGYLEDGSGSWLIIASTAGANWNPSWLHNLAKDPDATIELVGGRRIPVRAETLEGPDLEAAWRRVEQVARPYADYRTKTDREISVVRLRERPASAPA